MMANDSFAHPLTGPSVELNGGSIDGAAMRLKEDCWR
jgi:hypothetical protein